MFESRYTPTFEESSLTTAELVFIQNLAAATANDSTQVVLRAENWQLDTTPPETVNGVTLIFTIAANASQVVVYPDGIRAKGGSVDYVHTADTTTITFMSGRQPFTTLSVDYLPTQT